MRIGIIGAMDQEVRELKASIKDAQTKRIAGIEFYHGTIKGADVVVCQSGIGKVNMALCAQALINEYHPDCLVNTGIAGSLYDEIDIGDVVLSTEAVEHDMKATDFGYKLGQIPGMDTFAFPCDEKMRRIAKESCNIANPDIRVFEGRVLSGDEFIASRIRKKELITNFDGMCAEMEGAALAHVAYLNNIPALIFRIISDKADSVADEEFFEHTAAKYSLNLTLTFIERLNREGL